MRSDNNRVLGWDRLQIFTFW